MGSFRGHVIPGSVVLLVGLRWTFCAFWRYFLCLREKASTNGRSRRLKSSLTYPSHCCPSFPIDAVFMLSFTVIFSIGTFIETYHMDLHERSEHIAMYSFFGLAAAAVLLNHYGWPAVPRTDFACFVLNSLVNAYLMYRHTAGKAALERQVHEDGVFAVLATAVVLALEIKYQYNPLLPLMRGLSFSLVGSWVIMQGFILYSPWGAWAMEDPKSRMLSTIAFVGHIAGHVLFAGLMGLVAFVRVRRLTSEEVSLALDHEGLHHRENTDLKITPKTKQSEYLLVNSDDEV